MLFINNIIFLFVLFFLLSCYLCSFLIFLCHSKFLLTLLLSHSLILTFFISLSLSHTHTHTTISPSLTYTHTQNYLSLSHTHTFTKLYLSLFLSHTHTHTNSLSLSQLTRAKRDLNYHLVKVP